jgi:hypothetical protein
MKKKSGLVKSLVLGVKEALLRSGRKVSCSSMEPETSVGRPDRIVAGHKGWEPPEQVRELTQTGQRDTGTL